MMKQNLKHTPKLDMKRKIDFIESKPNKISTVKNKAPLKWEVLAELKAVLSKYSALKIENKQNLEINTNQADDIYKFDAHRWLNIMMLKMRKWKLLIMILRSTKWKSVQKTLNEIFVTNILETKEI